MDAQPCLPERAAVPGQVRRGLHPPEDCRALEDLRQYPLTTKQDLRDSYPYGMFAVPRERIARIHASSGTTGRPTVPTT
jgi:phenylacetate-CoA ligase